MKMQAKKALGQNFLQDEKVINDIINLLHVNERDLIIEIGPGRGALTKYLVNLNCMILCIEIDLDMHLFLDKYASAKTHIIYDDILNVDLGALLSNYDYDNLYIIGNLPYYITSPILEYLIKSKVNAREMYFMVQKEVAQRYTAQVGHKEYGYMTLFINYYYNASYEIYVDKTCFNPIPKVDSAVIQLVKKEPITFLDEEKYFAFLKMAFAHKRKTLRNNLPVEAYNKIYKMLNDHGYNADVRAEQIPQELFIEIFQKL